MPTIKVSRDYQLEIDFAVCIQQQGLELDSEHTHISKSAKKREAVEL